MCGLEIRSAVFGAQNLQNSLLNSLLAGNLGREWLAPDCLLRHTVWAAEKCGCIPLKIAGNCRNSAIPSLKPDRRKWPAERRRQAIGRFSPEAPCTVRFRRLHQANARRSATDDSAKAELTLVRVA